MFHTSKRTVFGDLAKSGATAKIATGISKLKITLDAKSFSTIMSKILKGNLSTCSKL